MALNTQRAPLYPLVLGLPIVVVSSTKRERYNPSSILGYNNTGSGGPDIWRV